MKKILAFGLCLAVLLFVSMAVFAQDAVEAPSQQLSLEEIMAEDGAVAVEPAVAAPVHALPFGYPPYPSVNENPAFGVPYSYPRAHRRLGSRLVPRQPFRPYMLPTPGAVPGALHPVAEPVPPVYRGELPPMQGVLGAQPAPVAPAAPVEPNVYYRPTPIKNFMALLTAPRPYIGYNPYGGPVSGAAPVYQPVPVQ